MATLKCLDKPLRTKLKRSSVTWRCFLWTTMFLTCCALVTVLVRYCSHYATFCLVIENVEVVVVCTRHVLSATGGHTKTHARWDMWEMTQYHAQERRSCLCADSQWKNKNKKRICVIFFFIFQAPGRSQITSLNASHIVIERWFADLGAFVYNLWKLYNITDWFSVI